MFKATDGKNHNNSKGSGRDCVAGRGNGTISENKCETLGWKVNEEECMNHGTGDGEGDGNDAGECDPVWIL
jgi:hypothetical protein